MAYRRSLLSVSEDEREELFISKLRVCQETYDFGDARKHLAKKELKRQCLVDVSEYIDNSAGVFTEAVYKPLFDMFAANLFRALPVGSSNDVFYDQEDDEPFLEPAWPHLQLVYELLRKFIVSNDTDPGLLRQCINTRFVLAMVELFNSEDPREREYLKTILHRVYGKIMQLRPFIRRAIMNVFHRFVYETHRHHGIAELLEIIGSIINGFATPLKEEHKECLRTALIPLHTPKSLPSYHVQLSFCITQFVEKDPGLAQDVVRGLVKFWPVTHSRKEVMLLNELEELLELIQPDDFGSVIEVLFRRIALCIESSHFQVAERALFFWNNEYIVSLIVFYRAQIVPLVYGSLVRNTESHWNTNVHSLSYNVQKLLSEMDGALYEESARAYEAEVEERRRQHRRRERRWAILEGREPSVSSSSCSGDDDAVMDEAVDGGAEAVSRTRSQTGASDDKLAAPGTATDGGVSRTNSGDSATSSSSSSSSNGRSCGRGAASDGSRDAQRAAPTLPGGGVAVTASRSGRAAAQGSGSSGSDASSGARDASCRDADGGLLSSWSVVSEVGHDGGGGASGCSSPAPMSPLSVDGPAVDGEATSATPASGASTAARVAVRPAAKTQASARPSAARRALRANDK